MTRTASLGALMFALSLLGCSERSEPAPSPGTSDSAIAIIPTTNALPLPTWEPQLYLVADFSPQAQQRINDEYSFSPGDAPSVYDILENGCSWYCGAGEIKVQTSSSLPATDKFTYSPDNIQDLRYDTAWVEGVEGDGVGESIAFSFSDKGFDVGEIVIVNGYVKSEDIWIKNNRVRTLELSVNGKPTAILSLADTRADQAFNLEELGIGVLGKRANGEPLELSFKILSVYPGNTYSDTAITEIYFDGPHGH